MKKIISVLFLVCAMFIFTSCANKDEVADEIVQYYNEEWIPINDMKRTRLDGYALKINELEQEGKEDEAISLIEDKMIPIIDKVLGELEDVEAENKKVKKINDKQIKAEEFAKDMSEDIIAYYEGDKSEDDIRSNKRKLESKYDKIIEYQDRLIDKYDLELSDEKIKSFNKLERSED